MVHRSQAGGVCEHVAAERGGGAHAGDYPAGGEFKFDTRSRPATVTKESFDAAKAEVTEANGAYMTKSPFHLFEKRPATQSLQSRT